MAMVGIRDLSIIETPPPERLSIRTVVAQFERDLVCEAIQREMARGGQVFFVHNRVHGIGSIARTLHEWLPSVRMGLAHGQMAEKELARVMERFHCKEIDLLLCTTIIEAGLDIPTANTILIHDAHKLGLAEMYQIRGRVGRSGHQAYAYLLLPSHEAGLTSDGLKRLQTLQEFSELGAGFRIATRDLEIRGAGTLLGPTQSGHVEAVGFELYTQLMQRAIATLKGEPLPAPIEPEIHLPVHAYLPEEYVPDAHQRLALYRRLTRTEGDDELRALREEMEDRFGPLPDPGENLLHLMGLRSLLRTLGIRLLSIQDGRLRVRFDSSTPVSPQRIVSLIQTHSNAGIRFLAEDMLEIPMDGSGDEPVPLTAKKRLKGLLLDARMES
jgi:transcription-repair coupling factor (superfamily II helicase)